MSDDKATLPDNIEDFNLTTESVFKICKDYKSNRLRVNIDRPIKVEQQKEAEATQKNIQEDRKYLIQAAIVRVHFKWAEIWDF